MRVRRLVVTGVVAIIAIGAATWMILGSMEAREQQRAEQDWQGGCMFVTIIVATPPGNH